MTFLYKSRLPEKYQNEILRSYSNNQSFVPEQRPTWGDTWAAQISYTYGRIKERISDVYTYGRDPTRTGYYAKRDKNYNAFDDLFGYEDYADYLTTNAVNAEHMAILKNRIEYNKKTRQVLADSSLLNQFTAGFFDPVNLVALPFGGPAIGIGRSALRVGAGVGVITAGQELARAPFDPLNQPYEVAINMAFGIGAGTILGGLTGIAPTLKAKAIKTEQAEMDSFLANVGGIKADEYFPGPNQIDRSPFANVSNEDLIKQKTVKDDELKKLTDEHESIRKRFYNGEDVYNKLTSLENKISNLKTEINPLKIESKLRLIDDAMSGKQDFKIASNALADGLLYNLVSVPLRRVINSKAGNKTKLMTMRLAADNGFLTTLEQMGLTASKGVYQLSQTRMGEMYKVMQSITNDWRNHAGKQEAFQKMTYNISNTSQRLKNLYNKVDSTDYLNVNPKDLTLQMYMKNVNYHRTFKTPLDELTEAQRKSIKALDTFYETYNQRLQSVGLLGQFDNINRSLGIKEKQLLKVKKEYNIHTETQPKETEFKSILENRIKELNEEIIELQGSAKFVDDVTEDKVFNPRFYNKQAILDNREKFEQIIKDSFLRDPFIYVKKGNEFVKEPMAIDEESLLKRAKQVTNNILGENDIANLDMTYNGSGRSKHLRHRQISATDQELFEFLEQDPLKVMRAYVSKVAPAYEFARAFNGKSIKDIRHEIYEDTLNNGGTLKDAYKHFKEFKHLYDRIVGVTVKNPDRLSYQTANVIRSLAQLNFLGRAVYSTISEPAKLFHDHHYKDVFKGMFTLIEAGFKGEGGKIARMQADEVMKAGEALDIVLQSTHLRFMDDLKSNPLQSNIWDKSRDVFFTLNGLAPVTNMLKQLDGIIRQHTIIDNSLKVKHGLATKEERLFLLRYGIDEDMANRIAKAKWQETDSGLYFANTEEWLNAKEFDHITSVKVISSSSDAPEWKGKQGVAAFARKEKKSVNKIEIRNVKTNELIDSYQDQKNYKKEIIKKKTTQTMELIDQDTGQIFRTLNTKDIKVDNNNVIFSKKTGEIFLDPQKTPNVVAIPRTITNVDFDTVRIVNKDTGEIVSEYPLGSDVNVTKTSYRPAKIYIDEEAVFQQFETKAWLKPRVEGVKPLPDIFKTKEDWKNFVQLHESYHIVYPRNKKGNKYTETLAEYENRINGLALKEFNRQTKIQTETLETFRASLNTGVLNTVLMGTPADKPIINDGIVYIPMSVARKFKMREDDLVKGYARIENGLLGLPFQFYSYSLAAVSKITGSFVQGTVKNRAAAISAALALAYMGQKLRTNEYTWEQLSYADKFARAFDYSGLASLHTAILYEAFHTSLALDGPDISGGLLKPKYNVNEGGPVDAVAGLFGAGPSIAFDFGTNSFTLATGKKLDYVEGGINFIDGDRSDAAAEIVRRLPFMTLPGVYGISREIANTIEDIGD